MITLTEMTKTISWFNKRVLFSSGPAAAMRRLKAGQLQVDRTARRMTLHDQVSGQRFVLDAVKLRAAAANNGQWVNFWDIVLGRTELAARIGAPRFSEVGLFEFSLALKGWLMEEGPEPLGIYAKTRLGHDGRLEYHTAPGAVFWRKMLNAGGLPGQEVYFLATKEVDQFLLYIIHAQSKEIITSLPIDPATGLCYLEMETGRKYMGVVNEYRQTYFGGTPIVWTNKVHRGDIRSWLSDEGGRRILAVFGMTQCDALPFSEVLGPAGEVNAILVGRYFGRPRACYEGNGLGWVEGTVKLPLLDLAGGRVGVRYTDANVQLPASVVKQGDLKPGGELAVKVSGANIIEYMPPGQAPLTTKKVFQFDTRAKRWCLVSAHRENISFADMKGLTLVQGIRSSVVERNDRRANGLIFKVGGKSYYLGTLSREMKIPPEHLTAIILDGELIFYSFDQSWPENNELVRIMGACCAAPENQERVIRSNNFRHWLGLAEQLFSQGRQRKESGLLLKAAKAYLLAFTESGSGVFLLKKAQEAYKYAAAYAREGNNCCQGEGAGLALADWLASVQEEMQKKALVVFGKAERLWQRQQNGASGLRQLLVAMKTVEELKRYLVLLSKTHPLARFYYIALSSFVRERTVDVQNNGSARKLEEARAMASE